MGTGSVVDTLDILLSDMETFSASSGKKTNNIDIKIEVEEKSDILEKKLDKLTDKLVNAFNNEEVQWTKERESLGHCGSCKKAIYDEGILSSSEMFHQDCFTCAHCGKRLGEIFYNVEKK